MIWLVERSLFEKNRSLAYIQIVFVAPLPFKQGRKLRSHDLSSPIYIRLPVTYRTGRFLAPTSPFISRSKDGR